jgi:hypothetical protein
MSDHFGVTQVITDHRKAPPAVQAGNRLGFGAMLLTACLYVASWSEPYFGGPPAIAIHRHPIIALVWAALMLLAGVWILSGLMGPREPRNPMGVFWSLVQGAVLICALKFHWWFPLNWEPRNWMIVIDLSIRGIYIALLVGVVVDLFLALRGGGPSDARKLVHSNIAENDFDWN